MSNKVPVAYIDIRVFIHATEDIDKVITAIHNILPAELTGEIDFKKTNIKGHYNNPIILLETRMKKKDSVKAIFERLATGLSSVDKELLNREIGQHLEKRDLFIRLDKQSAYSNQIKLNPRDPIHFRIRFRKSGEEAITKICRRFGMLP